MKKALIIRSGIRGEASVSNQLADVMEKHLATYNKYSVVTRDVASSLVPVMDGTIASAFRTDAADRNSTQSAIVAVSDSLVDELAAADVLVIAASMYNFTIPTQLKNYLDHIVRANKTFQYTPTGPKGLLRDKPVILLVASGGVYADGPAANADFVVPYLKQLLSFIGLTTVSVIRAEGQGMGADIASKNMDKAFAEISNLSL